MNHFLITLLFVAILSATVQGQKWTKNQIIKDKPELLKQLRGLRQDVIDRGCEINLCFAIDGSGSVTPAQFQRQKDFADLILNIITTDEPGNLAAVQYGTSLRPISPLTRKKNRFVKKLFRSKQVGGLTNIAGALGYCGFQLRPRIEDANKIIILGDGFSSIGFKPKRVSSRILAEGMDICAIAVGPSDVDGLNEITGDPGRVRRIKDFFDVGEIIVGIIQQSCGYI